MIDILFGAVLLLVAAACVLLFAMLGELNSRLPASSEAVRSGELRPLEEARLGAVPDFWPSAFSSIPDTPGPSIVVVLSTTCSACIDIAKQISAELDRDEAADLSVVISTVSGGNAESFIEQHGLRRVRYYIDEKGEWVSDQFDVRTSPTALIFFGGTLQSASIFHDIDALRASVTEFSGVK